jgi:hypothetical protein
MTFSTDQLKEAIALIKKGPTNADYFFEQLKSPVWIDPLAKEKLFAQPYEPIRQGDSISFPFWGPGQYLARMAAIPEAQSRVRAILEKLPPSENPRVYEIIADAASAMPPAMATQLVPQLLKGIELRFQLLLPEKIAAVVIHLATANLCAEALQLAAPLFAIIATPRPTDESEDDTNNRWAQREAKARFDTWDYGELLQRCLPSIVGACGMKSVVLMCDLLGEAVSEARLHAEEGPRDFSYIWRPEIAHSESHRDGIRDDLVTAVRDAANQVSASSPEALRQVVEYLNGRDTQVFRRIGLFLLHERRTKDAQLLEEIFVNPNDWEESGLHPEYEKLLAQYFGQLRPETQKRFLEWIEKGPDIESYAKFRRQMDGRDPEPDDIKRHREVWLRDHLGAIADHLLAPQKEQLAALVAQYGPPHETGPRSRISVGWRGEKSPLTEEETLSLNWPDLIVKLRDWSPPTADFDGPSEEGFAGSVRQRVDADPADAIRHLHLMADLPPRYASAVLGSLRDSLKKKQPLDWDSILAFLSPVVEAAHGASEDNERWRWVSMCAASLLDDGFDADAAAIPIGLRESVWPIIERLAENSNPTEDHETQYGGSNMDPATLSLNTVRGVTLHAVIRYALWWRRQIDSLPDASEHVQRGFDELPEVRALLEAHLDPKTDPSLAVRAVYGQWFPWLVLLDSKWATEHAKDIFPADAGQSQFFWAAWGTYVVFAGPFTNVLPILRPAYSRAIAELRDGAARSVGFRERPDLHLAEHLMAYYWRGELSFEAGDLVAAFFASADAKLRAHSLEWIGRSLNHVDEAPSKPVEKRLMALWEWRVAQKPSSPEELASFGWWFGSGKLEQDWSLQALQSILATSVLPEPDHLVAERLAIVAASNALVAVQSLDRMIDLASAGWSIHGWLDSARTILELGLKADDVAANERSERVIHKLGALRFRDFRSLLNKIATHTVDRSEE